MTLEFKQLNLRKCPLCKSVKIKFLMKKYDDRHGQADLFNIYRCLNCSALFLKNPVAEVYSSALYRKYYPQEKNLTPKLNPLQKLVNILKPLPYFLRLLTGNFTLIDKVPVKARVLDVGCGFNSSLIKEIKEKKLDWTGLEINPIVIKKLHQKNLNAIFGSLGKTSLKQKYDFILMSQVIEHYVNFNQILVECQKILNPGGKILILTPNTDSIYRRRYGALWLNWHVPYHTVLFNHKSIKKLLEKYHFKITKFSTFTPTYWYFWQKKFEVPPQGKKNKPLALSWTPFEFYGISVFLRVKEFFSRFNNDCIFMEVSFLGDEFLSA
jgi:2-polyprenyl-3-methyl-5-hydroxy-6-metoxy-1,4-benzoquinol methylase